MATIHCGDVLTTLTAYDEGTFDAVFCDPPYAMSWMGRSWDDFAGGEHAQEDAQEASDMQAFQRWCRLWGEQAIRVLKPGGNLVAFGGSRTYHRLACGLEDAGFDYQQTLSWIYASGMAKSHSVAKSLAKLTDYAHLSSQWEGWGTALKPAVESIVVMRKPGRYEVKSDGWAPGEFSAPFLFQAKPSVSERNLGCEDLYWKKSDRSSGFERITRGEWEVLGAEEDRLNQYGGRRIALRAQGNIHSTVKPTALARKLVQSICPPGGNLLVPFAGSGSEVLGSVLENRETVAVEREPEYVQIMQARLSAISAAVENKTSAMVVK